MARLTTRRRLWTAVGLLASITALTVGAWGLREWAPLAHEHPPVTWPKNVQPVVDFVQSEARLQFTDAVTVRFVPNRADFNALLAPAPRTDAAKARLQTDASLGRALGYWTGDVDLGAWADTTRNATSLASAYLLASNTVIIAAKDANTALTPMQRADLVVTLTEVLDDQHYPINARLRVASTSQQADALTGVAVGEGVFLHDRYIRRFNSADRTAYDTATSKRSDVFNAATTKVSTVYRAIRVMPQRLGVGFAAALHAEQPDRFARALTTDVPTALDQMEMPTAKYTRRDTTDIVHAPALPVNAQLLGHRQLGPFGLYLMLANGLPATEALTASDGWGNDAVTVYRAGAQTCADGRIVADTSSDADRIERGLNAWGHARPKEASALVGRKGTTLLFTVCDPGPSAHQTVVGADALDQFFGRTEELIQQLTSHGQPTRSECIAVSAYAKYVASDLNLAVLDRITADCDSSV
jgi:hypothetical protein